MLNQRKERFPTGARLSGWGSRARSSSSPGTRRRARGNEGGTRGEGCGKRAQDAPPAPDGHAVLRLRRCAVRPPWGASVSLSQHQQLNVCDGDAHDATQTSREAKRPFSARRHARPQRQQWSSKEKNAMAMERRNSRATRNLNPRELKLTETVGRHSRKP